MVHIAVCDDEKPFRKSLIDKLSSFAELHGLDFLIDEFSDGKELVSSKRSYDVIFLDYQMKEYNGIETASVFRERNDDVTVIFVSSFPDVVFDSMKVGTFRFLVKPVGDAEFDEALSSCIKKLEGDNYLIVDDPENGQSCRIDQNDIIYCEAENFYSRVRTKNSYYRFNSTLSKLESKLTLKCFFRTHRSYIVNLKYVDRYTEDRVFFNNGEKAALAKNKRTEFKEKYFKAMKWW